MLLGLLLSRMEEVLDNSSWERVTPHVVSGSWQTLGKRTSDAAQGSSRASGQKEGKEEYPWGSRSEAWHPLRAFLESLCGEVGNTGTRCQTGRSPSPTNT